MLTTVNTINVLIEIVDVDDDDDSFVVQPVDLAHD
jgi:hypothetical protein